jgi:hypothetical protein
MRSMVEGAPLEANLALRAWAPSTTQLRWAVPLPVPGRIKRGYRCSTKS